jgi:hypothetical protein
MLIPSFLHRAKTAYMEYLFTYVLLCLPTDPVEANTVQTTPLNLIDAVDYDGGHSGDGVGAEGSEVKVLNLLSLRGGSTGDTGKGSLTATLGVARHTAVYM